MYVEVFRDRLRKRLAQESTDRTSRTPNPCK
jgi:hypothetical protein